MHGSPDGMDRLAPTRRPANRRVVMRQRWQALLFLHWEVEPAPLAALLPPGLTLDTDADGRAWIGLVPFTMRDVRPLWSPSVPGVSHFHECNVRTYVHHQGRDPGVWFFSLDAANPLAVAVARGVWRLPYFLARMSLQRDGDGMTRYRTCRVLPGPTPAGCRVEYRPDGAPAPAAPGTLEHFLAERYILYARGAGGRLWSGRVHHAPYPLQAARVTVLEDSLVRAAGVALPPERIAPGVPFAHYAAGVDVEVFPLRPVAGAVHGPEDLCAPPPGAVP